MSFTNNLETELLDHVFAGNAFSSPSTLYVSLHTANPGETGSTTNEVSGGAYARQTATFTVSGNTATTSAAIEFPTATASYGTVTHIGVHSASTGTSGFLAYAALTDSKTIATGDVFRIPAGDIDITLD